MGNCGKILKSQKFPSNNTDISETNFQMNNSARLQNYTFPQENNPYNNRKFNIPIYNQNPQNGYPNPIIQNQNNTPPTASNTLSNVIREENKDINLDELNKLRKNIQDKQQNIDIKNNLIDKQADENIKLKESLKIIQEEKEKKNLEQNKQIQKLIVELNQRNQEKLNLQKNFDELKIKYDELVPITVGLQNIGATCYMNATLQSLSNVKELTDYFLKKFIPGDPNKRMSNEYYIVIKNLWDIKNNGKSFAPTSFKENLSQMNPSFAGVEANDSKDLINYLIEIIHSELNQTNVQKNNIIATPNDQSNEQKMLQIFFADLKSNYNQNV